MENDSNDFIRDIKDTSAVTLATNDDKQHKAHNNSVMLKRINLSLRSMKMMIANCHLLTTTRRTDEGRGKKD